MAQTETLRSSSQGRAGTSHCAMGQAGLSVGVLLKGLLPHPLRSLPTVKLLCLQDTRAFGEPGFPRTYGKRMHASHHTAHTLHTHTHTHTHTTHNTHTAHCTHTHNTHHTLHTAHTNIHTYTTTTPTPWPLHKSHSHSHLEGGDSKGGPHPGHLPNVNQCGMDEHLECNPLQTWHTEHINTSLHSAPWKHLL